MAYRGSTGTSMHLVRRPGRRRHRGYGLKEAERAGPVTIKRSDGSVEVRPAYGKDELLKILKSKRRSNR